MELIVCLIIGYAIGRIVTNDKSYKAGHDAGVKEGKKQAQDEAKKAAEPYVTLTTADGRKHKIKVE